jgi:hypothetical protein
LYEELVDDTIITDKAVITTETFQSIVNDALEANINSESLIYQYCEIIILNPILFKKPFPSWVNNILYSDIEPEDKIISLSNYLKN